MGFVILLIFSVGIYVVQPSDIESNFYQESSCPGYCVLENECPHAVDSDYKNKCPMQKAAGAVCCKDFPPEKANCYQLHNACMDHCSPIVNIGTKGCTGGKTCCVLVT